MVDDAWLSLVRIARDCGDVSSLLPPGVKSLYDAPHLFVQAVRRALQYLSFDELAEEERPPKKIWLDNDKMTEWFDSVKRNRKSKANGQGDFQNMPENEALRDIFKGRGFRG
jgi:hypothetical protein